MPSPAGTPATSRCAPSTPPPSAPPSRRPPPCIPPLYISPVYLPHISRQARRRLLGAFSADGLGRLYQLRAPAELRTKASVDRYEAEVDRLALLLLNGGTSLFLGAGVSINAGLPTWSALIDLLAIELAISDEDRDSLARLNPLEAASL